MDASCFYHHIVIVIIVIATISSIHYMPAWCEVCQFFSQFFSLSSCPIISNLISHHSPLLCLLEPLLSPSNVPDMPATGLYVSVACFGNAFCDHSVSERSTHPCPHCLLVSSLSFCICLTWCLLASPSMEIQEDSSFFLILFPALGPVPRTVLHM